MDSVRRGLADIGYTKALLRENYDYALLSPDCADTGRVDLAAFGATPPSYRNACIGVAVANGRPGEALVSRCRDLGAPQILEVCTDALHRWGFDGQGRPWHIEQVPRNDVPNLFDVHKTAWAPQSILRAKALHQNDQETRQLDFYDAGFFPLIESLVKKKLDNLLRDTLATTTTVHKASTKKAIDAQELFRLVFRFLAGKILVDRGALSSAQTGSPDDTLQAVDTYYDMAAEGFRPTSIRDVDTLMAAWKSIRSGLNFRNLSGDDLAFVYENTLVSTGTRKQLGTHATPPSVAEYIVRKLPFEDLKQENRRVLEPCSGHGVFLLSAMRRLRELLPSDMTDAQRHRYLRPRLVGIEIDAFAVEVARLSLMLADFPNKNDWQLYSEDVFTGNRLDRELRKSQCVLCNPPFGRFSDQELSKITDSASLHRATEVFGRVLQHPPELLGFVLPKSFLSGTKNRKLHRKLLRTYGELELMVLPDHVFTHSHEETVLVTAWRRTTSTRHTLVTCRDVTSGNLPSFLRHSEEPRGRSAEIDEARFQVPDFNIWIRRLDNVWAYLSDYPSLSQFVDIHRGLEYSIPTSWREDDPSSKATFSRSSGTGFKKGLVNSKKEIEQYRIRSCSYLRTSSHMMRTGAHNHPWHLPKLLCNAARITTGPWRLLSVLDRSGLVAYQNLHGVWPRNCGLLQLMAVFNSPVANAFVFDSEINRHNKISTLKKIPVPPEFGTDSVLERAVSDLLKAIGSCEDGVSQGADEKVRRLLLEVDARLLRLYNFPPRIERELLDTFEGYERPVPGVSFRGYYPEGFKACFPLHEIISGDFERARAKNLLKRLSPVDDPVIHEMLAIHEDGDE